MTQLTLTILATSILVAVPAIQAQEPPPETVPAPAANRLTVVAAARLDSRRGDTIQLAYSIASAPGSVQSGRTFTVRAYAKSWVVSAPLRWFGDSANVQDSSAVIWSSFSITDLLTPGTQRTGFVAAGVGATDLVPFRVRGHFAAPVYVDGARTVHEDPPSVWVNAAQGTTVGLVPVPTGTTAQLLSRLASLNTRACELGWVSPAAACATLDARLTACSTALAGGDAKAARSELDAYISELEARRGTDVSENGFALLWPNAKAVRERM